MKYYILEKPSILLSKGAPYHKIINAQAEIWKILNVLGSCFQSFSQFVYKLWKTSKNTSSMICIDKKNKENYWNHCVKYQEINF